MPRCSRCGYAGNHSCPADRPDLSRLLRAATVYLDRTHRLHRRLLSQIDWTSKDPEQVPVEAAEALLDDVRALLVLASVIRARAHDLADSLTRTILELKREKDRRADPEYEWPSEYPPVPIVPAHKEYRP